MNNKRDQIRRGQFDSERRVKELIDTSEFKEEEGIDVPFFDMQTILDATVNFSNANKLGQGGYGPVYKGMFLGGQEIAVKRLSRVSGQGLQEFRNEVVLIAEKIGQMTQIKQTVATPDVMNKYFIGNQTIFTLIFNSSSHPICVLFCLSVLNFLFDRYSDLI
nr:G-type lectin S-receptor-like serine/threonine-protein kinase At4g03230 [Malus domestica]